MRTNIMLNKGFSISSICFKNSFNYDNYNNNNQIGLEHLEVTLKNNYKNENSSFNQKLGSIVSENIDEEKNKNPKTFLNEFYSNKPLFEYSCNKSLNHNNNNKNNKENNFNNFAKAIKNDKSNLIVLQLGGLYSVINKVVSKSGKNVKINLKSDNIQQKLSAYSDYLNDIYNNLDSNDRLIIISDYKFNNEIYSNDLYDEPKNKRIYGAQIS